MQPLRWSTLRTLRYLTDHVVLPGISGKMATSGGFSVLSFHAWLIAEVFLVLLLVKGKCWNFHFLMISQRCITFLAQCNVLRLATCTIVLITIVGGNVCRNSSNCVSFCSLKFVNVDIWKELKDFFVEIKIFYLYLMEREKIIWL